MQFYALQQVQVKCMYSIQKLFSKRFRIPDFEVTFPGLTQGSGDVLQMNRLTIVRLVRVEVVLCVTWKRQHTSCSMCVFF